MRSKAEIKTSMSRVAREVLKAMTLIEATAPDEATATFVFDEDFIGFKGHFPEGAVLPGVCQTECVLALLSHYKGAHARLAEITSAKYVQPALPGDVLTCSISSLKEAGEDTVSLKASLLKGGERVSDFRLKARLAPARDSR